MTIKTLLTYALAVAFLLAAPTMTFAKGGKAPKDNPYIVSAVDATANTITVKQVVKKADTNVTTYKAADAKVTVNGAPGKLADVLIGMDVKVTPGATADTAAIIDATTAPAKDKKKKKK